MDLEFFVMFYVLFIFSLFIKGEYYIAWSFILLFFTIIVSFKIIRFIIGYLENKEEKDVRKNR